MHIGTRIEQVGRGKCIVDYGGKYLEIVMSSEKVHSREGGRECGGE